MQQTGDLAITAKLTFVALVQSGSLQRARCALYDQVTLRGFCWIPKRYATKEDLFPKPLGSGPPPSRGGVVLNLAASFQDKPGTWLKNRHIAGDIEAYLRSTRPYASGSPAQARTVLPSEHGCCTSLSK
jgi:hypothetical protein